MRSSSAGYDLDWGSSRSECWLSCGRGRGPGGAYGNGDAADATQTVRAEISGSASIGGKG